MLRRTRRGPGRAPTRSWRRSGGRCARASRLTRRDTLSPALRSLRRGLPWHAWRAQRRLRAQPRGAKQTAAALPPGDLWLLPVLLGTVLCETLMSAPARCELFAGYLLLVWAACDSGFKQTLWLQRVEPCCRRVAGDGPAAPGHLARAHPADGAHGPPTQVIGMPNTLTSLHAQNPNLAMHVVCMLCALLLLNHTPDPIISTASPKTHCRHTCDLLPVPSWSHPGFFKFFACSGMR